MTIHGHMLRMAAASAAGVAPEIGDPFEGGYFGGLIRYPDNTVYALIVMDKATCEAWGREQMKSPAGYHFNPSGQSVFDGMDNTNKMLGDKQDNPALDLVAYARQMNLFGYADWYIPAQFELEILFFNLKPRTATGSAGLPRNNYAIPARTSGYDVTKPQQTASPLFKLGGQQEFLNSSSLNGRYWYSTTFSGTPRGGYITFYNGDHHQGEPLNNRNNLRLIRRVPWTFPIKEEE